MNVVHSINYPTAKKLQNNGGIIVDVRSKAEHKKYHLPNSICLPLEDIFDLHQKFLPNKNSPVIVYCETGARSRIATVFLKNLGYRQIYDLGGIKYL